MQAAQQLDPGVRAQRLEEGAVHAGKINGSLARHAAHRIRTGQAMPPSYRQANFSGYAVKGGEVNGYPACSEVSEDPSVFVKPHGVLTSRIVLILLKYDPLVPRIPWGCRHSSSC